MSSRKRKVTIYDVAQKAGVAISTVSRVLNDSPNVSLQTKNKVNDAIKALNFRPQVSARNLASRKPQMMAVAVPSFTTPYYNEVLKGIKDQIQDMDLDILIYNTGSKNPEEAVENFFDRGTADLIIVISINISESVHQQIQVSGIPTVLIGTSHPSYDYFNLNDFNGGFIAGEHLIKQGYSTIGMILPAMETKASRERQKGFLAAMEKYKIPVQEKYFVKGQSIKHAGFTEEAGFEAIFEYEKMDDFPEAIFALNDTQAVGAIHALGKIGKRIPDDIGLIGYDNIKLAKYLDLSTIDQQMKTVGEKATRRLKELIGNPDSKPQQIDIKPVLVQRKSTQKPA